jgi:hypothetical protein
MSLGEVRRFVFYHRTVDCRYLRASDRWCTDEWVVVVRRAVVWLEQTVAAQARLGLGLDALEVHLGWTTVEQYLAGVPWDRLVLGLAQVPQFQVVVWNCLKP